MKQTPICNILSALMSYRSSTLRARLEYAVGDESLPVNSFLRRKSAVTAGVVAMSGRNRIL